MASTPKTPVHLWSMDQLVETSPQPYLLGMNRLRVLEAHPDDPCAVRWRRERDGFLALHTDIELWRRLRPRLQRFTSMDPVRLLTDVKHELSREYPWVPPPSRRRPRKLPSKEAMREAHTALRAAKGDGPMPDGWIAWNRGHVSRVDENESPEERDARQFWQRLRNERVAREHDVRKRCN